MCADGCGRDVVIKKTGHTSESDLEFFEVCRKQEIGIRKEQTSATVMVNDNKENTSASTAVTHQLQLYQSLQNLLLKKMHVKHQFFDFLLNAIVIVLLRQ